MLDQSQIDAFNRDGVIVVPDVLPGEVLAAVRAEYAGLLDTLYAGWHREGRVPAPEGRDFQDKLLTSYKAGCDWFQPMDISLPAL